MKTLYFLYMRPQLFLYCQDPAASKDWEYLLPKMTEYYESPHTVQYDHGGDPWERPQFANKIFKS